MSAAESLSGISAVKSRRTRSTAKVRSDAAIVVVTVPRLRLTPAISASRIRRATRLRPSLTPPAPKLNLDARRGTGSVRNDVDRADATQQGRIVSLPVRRSAVALRAKAGR